MMVSYGVGKIIFMKNFSYMKNSDKGIFRDKSRAEETLENIYLHICMIE